MGGLAIGSFFGGRRADLARWPLRTYGLVELGVGATALLTPWVFRLLQDIYGGLSQVVDPGQAPLVAGGVRAALAFAVLLVPTALMGATLPLAVRGVRLTRGDTRADAWAMGLLYATNTAGAIVGCLLSGFLLIGRLGLTETIAAAAAANGLAGLGALALSAFPLPLGEGQGEGCVSSQTFDLVRTPHPSPLPEGEGVGEGAQSLTASSSMLILS